MRFHQGGPWNGCQWIFKWEKEVGNLIFDKDDLLAVEFVTAAANIRAASFDIPLHSLLEVKGITDNILRQADIFRAEKNIIDLYVMLLRYPSLASETTARHREYKSSPQTKKQSLKRNFQIIFKHSPLPRIGGATTWQIWKNYSWIYITCYIGKVTKLCVYVNHSIAHWCMSSYAWRIAVTSFVCNRT